MTDGAVVSCGFRSAYLVPKINLISRQNCHNKSKKEEKDTPKVKLNFHIGGAQSTHVAAAATVAAGPRTGDAQRASIAEDDDDWQHEYGVTEEFYR